MIIEFSQQMVIAMIGNEGWSWSWKTVVSDMTIWLLTFSLSLKNKMWFIVTVILAIVFVISLSSTLRVASKPKLIYQGSLKEIQTFVCFIQDKQLKDDRI